MSAHFLQKCDKQTNYRMAEATTDVSTFSTEIEAMLHALGDVWKPLPQTVSLVETILHKKLCTILQKASQVAEMRGSPAIGLEEFVFLLRNNKPKLVHFVQHVKFKDLKSSLSRNLDAEDLENDDSKQSKRYKVCLEFLQMIDNRGGYVTSSLADVDVIRISRQERAEKQTRQMTSEQYVKFAQCRQVTFSNRLSKFCEWFDVILPILPRQPNSSGWETLAYIAHETVGEIVDLSLLVQKDQRDNHKHVSGHSSLTLAPSEPAKTDASENLNVSLGEGKFQNELALKPSHIKEALRRCPNFFK
uniref:Transcription initiation protein SPT3 homolog n=1 Tax=Phallusia mammillata TaxID=59560 RepID=A0A6F9DUL8_9ASCI|nr:transcription initiation protein SPT3 homolog [Phallusia mammillata]